MSAPAAADSVPWLPPGELDVLWLQVGGTLCNLHCEHCFIACSPTNHALELMERDQIERVLETAAELGVREYYLTGGEPFIRKDLEDLVARILQQGPVSVLTNATLITAARAAHLAEIRAAARYALELRVSLDGCTAATNDPIRGPGTFERALRGYEHLVRAGFLPIVTAAQMWEPAEEPAVLAGFVAELQRRGSTRPRLKILPRLKLGAEARRTGGYEAAERVTVDLMEGYDPAHLLCHGSRTVSARGVHICPILVDTPAGHLGDDLASSMRPYPLAEAACYTCWLHGNICANTASAAGFGQAT